MSTCETVEACTKVLELKSEDQSQRASTLETWRSDGFEGKSFDEWNKKHERQSEFFSRIALGACIRSIEDWCLCRMKNIWGLAEDELTHDKVVDRILANYLPVSTERSYLLCLKLLAD